MNISGVKFKLKPVAMPTDGTEVNMSHDADVFLFALVFGLITVSFSLLAPELWSSSCWEPIVHRSVVVSPPPPLLLWSRSVNADKVRFHVMLL